MKYLILLLVMNLFCQTYANNPLAVKKEEIGKKGYFNIKQPGVPIHKDFEKIYQYCPRFNLKKDPTDTFYLTTSKSARFTVFVPVSYNPDIPAGLVFFGVEDLYRIKTSSIIKSIKDAFTKRNLIAVTVNAHRRSLKGEDSAYENAVHIRRSIDIVKERYNIDSDRIIGYSYNNNLSYSIAAFTCPDIFKYNIIYSGKVNFAGYAYPYSGPSLDFKSIVENYYIYYVFNNRKDTSPNNLQHDPNSKEFFNKKKFKNVELVNLDTKDPKKLSDFSEIIDFIDKIDPKPFDAEKYLKNAVKYERMRKYPQAYTNYKIASTYGFEEAEKKYIKMNKELTSNESIMSDSHKKKNYPQAYKSAYLILKRFGSKNSPEAQKIYKTYTKDKQIALEIKYSALLEKIELALKRKSPNLVKIKAVCKKTIEQCPDTNTAEKAKKILDSLI